MVPRPDMVAVEGRDRIGDVIEVAIASGRAASGLRAEQSTTWSDRLTKDLLRAEREGRADEEGRNLVRRCTSSTRPSGSPSCCRR